MSTTIPTPPAPAAPARKPKAARAATRTARRDLEAAAAYLTAPIIVLFAWDAGSLPDWLVRAVHDGRARQVRHVDPVERQDLASCEEALCYLYALCLSRPFPSTVWFAIYSWLGAEVMCRRPGLPGKPAVTEAELARWLQVPALEVQALGDHERERLDHLRRWLRGQARRAGLERLRDARRAERAQAAADAPGEHDESGAESGKGRAETGERP